MKANEARKESEWMDKARRVGTTIRIGYENFMAAIFLFEGFGIALSLVLITFCILTNPELLLTLSFKNWTLSVSFIMYAYLVSVMCYNAGIEHFPKLHPYKAPAPKILKRISLYVYNHMIIMKSHRSP